MALTIKEAIELYISDPLKRTRDQITDNTKIVEDFKQLSIMEKPDKIDKKIVNKFLCLLAEEQLRRYNIKLEEDEDDADNDDFQTYIAQILSIDIDKYVDEYIQEIVDEYLAEHVVDIETYFENKIKLILKISTDDVCDCDYNFNELSIQAKKLFVIYKAAFHKLILPLLKACDFIADEEIDFSSLKSLGITSNEQFLALIIQNRINNSDDKMKKSIENDEYVDYLEKSTEYLQNVVNFIIKEKREYTIDVATDKISTYNQDIILKLFKETDNMNIAAGILKGLSHGHSLFSKIINILQTEDCVNPLRKLCMLKKGTYLDIILICDNNGYTQKWIPSKTNLNKLINNNMDNIPKVTWLNLFPKYTAYISNIFHKENRMKPHDHNISYIA